MRSISSLILLLLFFAACSDNNHADKSIEKKKDPTPSVMFFGEKITEDGARPVDSLAAMMAGQTELNCKVQGPVDAVCQKKGCWMELKQADGNTVRVTFKDYAFFMPKDCSGKTAIVDGIAKVEETSVADLKEYAKDDGQSNEQIAAITAPRRELVFEAKGVILK